MFYCRKDRSVSNTQTCVPLISVTSFLKCLDECECIIIEAGHSSLITFFGKMAECSTADRCYPHRQTKRRRRFTSLIPNKMGHRPEIQPHARGVLTCKCGEMCCHVAAPTLNFFFQGCPGGQLANQGQIPLD